jgi:predicted nucleic acid-binding protein
VTSSKIFVQPTPIADAVAFVDAILAMSGVVLASLGPEKPKLRQLCLDKQLAGKDLHDGWLAAAVDQQAEHLVSFDRDFRKLLVRTRFTLLKARASRGASRRESR